MTQQSGREEMIRCRVARGRFPALLAAEDTPAVSSRYGLSATERAAKRQSSAGKQECIAATL